MGCDGGTIPKRHELVKTKAKDERPDKASQTDAKWACCAISKDPLKEPVVACGLGKLYNYETVIQFLLNKKNFADGDVVAGHLLSVKDVVRLNLTSNPAAGENEQNSTAILGNTVERPKFAQWVCPVTMKEMNGKNRFSYISSCGCVLSEQAMKEVPSATCLKCNKAFNAERDVVPLNSEIPSEIEKLTLVVEAAKAEKLAADAAKKAAKLAKKAGKTVPVGSRNDDAAAAKKRKAETTADDKVEKNSATAAKKQATDAAAAARANINMPLPNMDSMLGGKGSLMEKSDAIKSLYAKDPNRSKGNYLTMGTFTRYAAF